MDVQATTSHELVQTENQTAVDALRRLSNTREALARMFGATSTFTETETRGVHDMLEALPAFWASPEAGGPTRASMLGLHLASVMKEQAILRGLDGTLGTDAAALAARVAAAGDSALPNDVHAYELMLGDMPQAGSLIVVPEGRSDLALLFTSHGGWEAYDSAERLLEFTRRRLLESVDVAGGKGLDEDEFAEARVRGSVGAREISGPAFTALARRMVEVQIGRVTLAADDHTIDADEPHAAVRMSDRLRYELSAAAVLDIDGIERLREARLIEAGIVDRLANLPPPVRAAWYDARDAYNNALATATLLGGAAGVQPPLTLRAFASRELAARLVALGVEESPESITVEVARIRVLPAPLESLDPLPGSPATRRLPLIDLASQNIGRFSLETLHAVDASGVSLRDRLGHGAIRDMVRELDIGSRYQGHLEERLQTGTAGALARKLAINVQASRMRLEAADARLSYYLANEPRSFIDDREERGFRWVEAALDAPSGQRRVGAHDIVVSQLTYQQVPLDGVFIFASRAPSSAPRIVMYTPGAPDGLVFREFESRQEAAKQFLYHPAFREYLLDRLPAEFATVSANGMTRTFAGDHLAHWVLGARGDASYTLTAEPFAERETQGDFLAAGHDATLGKHQRDVRFLTRSTAGADTDSVFGYLQDRFNPSANLAATLLADVPASLSRMAQASWRLYDHVKTGDTGEAVVALADGYVNALNLVVPPLVGGRHVAGAIVRSRTAARGIANTRVRLPQAHARFDDRYAAGPLRKAGLPDGEGIYRAQGQSYIEQDGTFFLVRHDGDYGRWRLAPTRGALDTHFTGPLIERIDDRWVHGTDAGLRGGMRRMRERLNRLVVRDDAGANAPAREGAAAPGQVPDAAPARDRSRSPIHLPAPMEPFRAEVEAVLRDNSSAEAMVRNDGAYMKFAVHPRSALILDPHLHPDIAALSAHQRRVFLHELDTRFPLAGERAEVLNARGGAPWEGRRVSSPTPFPGMSQHSDIQSPSISSSAGDAVAPPTLTASQQARWDEALAAGRNAPRTSPRSSTSSTSDVVTENLSASEVVPLHEWPDRLWYFSDRNFQSEHWPASGGDGVTLGEASSWIDATSGARSYPVSVLPPETPLNLLSEALGTSPVQQTGRRDPLGYALTIDAASLRGRTDFIRLGHQRQRPFELRRRVLPNGEYQYSLQANGPAQIPEHSIISVQRRGGRPDRFPSHRI